MGSSARRATSSCLPHVIANTIVVIAILVLPISSKSQTSQKGNGSVQSAVTVDKSGTIHLPQLDIPLSEFLTPTARRISEYFRMLNAASHHAEDGSPYNTEFDHYFQSALTRTLTLYPVTSTDVTISGVAAREILPKDGVSKENRRRVLIELHGGGFQGGWDLIDKMEAAPVASIGGLRVVSVNYREGPRFRFPSASEDVAAVYKELLKNYSAENIGLYGASAGGVLVAEAIAWFQKEHLPRPGAAAILSASAGGWAGGDSTYLSQPLMGMAPVNPKSFKHPEVFNVGDTAYFIDADFKNPLVAPIVSPAVLAQFPPTIILTSTRAVDMSPAVYTHTQLVKQGVDADLHVWEGLPHGFMVNEPDFPESKDAWGVVVKFFDKHLGH
jgi:epsilon-lactone hydrolase